MFFLDVVATADINCNVFSIMVNFKDIMINMETLISLQYCL